MPVREEYREAVWVAILELVDERFVAAARRECIDVATERDPARVGEAVLFEARHGFF